MLELMDINDDCLEHIFWCCDVKAQLSLKKVCERFDYIFERNWRNRHKILAYHHERYHSVMYDKEIFPEVVPLIDDYVEEIYFNTVAQLRCLITRVWPKVRYVTGFFLQEHLSTDDAELRTRNVNFSTVFPALERLQMTWTLENGDYGNNWFRSQGTPPVEIFPDSRFEAHEYTYFVLKMILQHSSRGLHTLSYNFVSNWHNGLERLGSLRDLRRLNFCACLDSSQGMVALIDELTRVREVHYRPERWMSKDNGLTQVCHFISLCEHALGLRPTGRTIALHLYCYVERPAFDYLKEKFSDSEMLRIFYVDSFLNGHVWPLYNKISFQCEWDKTRKRKSTHSLSE